MPPLTWKRQYVKKSISFPVDLLAGAQRIAICEGHGNVSRVMQDILEADLKRRYGRDWRTEAAIDDVPDELERAHREIAQAAVA